MLESGQNLNHVFGGANVCVCWPLWSPATFCFGHDQVRFHSWDSKLGAVQPSSGEPMQHLGMYLFKESFWKSSRHSQFIARMMYKSQGTPSYDRHLGTTDTTNRVWVGFELGPRMGCSNPTAPLAIATLAHWNMNSCFARVPYSAPPVMKAIEVRFGGLAKDLLTPPPMWALKAGTFVLHWLD